MTVSKIFVPIMILILFFGIPHRSCADELISPTLSISYYKLSDGTKRIKVSLSARVDDKRVKIMDAKVYLETLNEITAKDLGEAVTDNEGKVLFELAAENILPKNKEGFFTFNLRFNGNNRFEKAEKTISVMDAGISLSFAGEDSIKTITAQIYTMDENDKKKFIQDVQVEFCVERLFSLHPIGTEKTDSTGICTTVFPSTMPGDTNGKVTIVARIVDDEVYGNVEKSADQNWGKPLFVEKRSKRGLGDTDAPLWMVYTLFILLSGVWLHVFYVLLTIFRINLIGRKAIKEGLI